MSKLIIVIIILFSSQLYSQKFDYVETTTIDSVDAINQQYVTDIEFRLDKEDRSLLIIEYGKPVLIRFDIIHEKKNGIYLMTIGKPDYFIINPNWVLHHQEKYTKVGIVIIRNIYKTSSIKI